MIADSKFTEGPVQPDGRFYVTETHEITDGQIFTYEYLAEVGTNPEFVLEARAAQINSILAAREAARVAVIGTSVPLTKYEFLGRFTAGERIAIRTAAKTDAIVEDFMEMMKLSGNVSLTLARPGINYLASIGCFSAERALVIGAE